MSYSMNADSMRALDNYSIEKIGIEGAVLMERAALKVAEHMLAEIPHDSVICIVFGQGNNGGDGLAVGRIMALEGFTVKAVPAVSGLLENDGAKLSLLCKKQLESAKLCGVELLQTSEIGGLLTDKDTVIVDSIFGIGLKRAIEGEIAELIEHINASGCRVYAVDIPSGISADTGAVLGCAIRACATITFGFMKNGLLLYPAAEYAGRIYVEDAGFAIRDYNAHDFLEERMVPGKVSCVGQEVRQPEGQFAEKEVRQPEGHFVQKEKSLEVTYFANPSEVKLPKRFPYSNKGSYGKLLIIGGAQGYSGAALLAAYSAYMSGVGMVKVLTCKDTVITLNTRMPEVMTGILFDGDNFCEDALSEGLKWCTNVLIGPGLGMSENAKRAVDEVLACGKPVVVDADALNILSAEVDAPQNKRAAEIASRFTTNAVLTPHMGELSRLTGQKINTLKSSIFDTAYEYTYNNNLTYVCKDARTVVANGGRLHVNINGNSGMSTAGAGDVLAGLIGGLMSAGLEGYEAAKTGVYIHAMAGDLAAEEECEACVTAGKLAEKLPECMKALSKA